jgi:hypothetical protein
MHARLRHKILHLSEPRTCGRANRRFGAGHSRSNSRRTPKGFEAGRWRCTWPASPSTEGKESRCRTCRIHIHVPLILAQTLLRVRVRVRVLIAGLGRPEVRISCTSETSAPFGLSEKATKSRRGAKDPSAMWSDTMRRALSANVSKAIPSPAKAPFLKTWDLRRLLPCFCQRLDEGHAHKNGEQGSSLQRADQRSAISEQIAETSCLPERHGRRRF